MQLQEPVLKQNNSQGGLSLLEILISMIILAVIMTGVSRLFLSGRKLILHSRSRITAAELGKYFLDPLQMDVRQDLWGSNCLSSGIGCPGAQTINNITYTPTYSRTLNSPISNLNKVKVTITWTE